MVDMRVRDDHKINLLRIKGELPVVAAVRALLKATVNQDLFPTGFQAVAAPCYFLVRAVKNQFHSVFSLSPSDPAPPRSKSSTGQWSLPLTSVKILLSATLLRKESETKK